MEAKIHAQNEANIDPDKNLAVYAFLMIVVYLVLVLGSFSPIHCKFSVAIVGIICIALSVGSGFGLGIATGYVQTEAHEALPILMLGIGVDDMFIVCNALD